MTTKLSPTAQRTKGALIAYLGPRMAQDAAIPKLSAALGDVSAQNFGMMIPTIARRVRSAVRGKLAQDADIDDIVDLLDALEEEREEEGEDEIEAEPNHGGDPEDVASDPWPEAHHGAEDEGEHELVAKIKEMLGAHVPPEMLAKIDEMVGEHGAMQAEHDAHLMEDEYFDRRADDARKHHGRDETPEEMMEREEREEGEDMRRDASDKRLSAEDRKHRAEDRKRAHDRRHARDKKRAEDMQGLDGKKAEDMRKKHRAEDRRRAEDARCRAEDRRHADDKRAEDDPPDFGGKPETGGSMVPMNQDGVKKMVDDAVRHAKDEAIAVREAERFVRPWVGEFKPELAMDSADDVYRQTLRMLGVKAEKDWPTAALRALVASQPQPSARRNQHEPAIALDARPSEKPFTERFAFAKNVVTA